MIAIVAAEFVALAVGHDDVGRRIDRIVRKVSPEMALGRVYAAIRSGAVRVDGRRTSPDHRLKSGEVLSVRADLPVDKTAFLSSPAGPPASRELPNAPDSPIADRIVFENRDIVVVAKLRGELVHGPVSLERNVRAWLSVRPSRGISFVPGPVHRLDRNTTGLVVFAASLRGAQIMTEAIQSGGMTKRYAAVIEGRLSSSVAWRDALRRDDAARRTVGDPKGLPAESRVDPVAVGSEATLAEIDISSGRTHQIRSHAQINGHPLVGDRKYGGKPVRGGYILHAGYLELSAEFSDIGFRTLWQPLPPEPSRRIAAEFGTTALQRLYARWSE